ncbi:cytochrome P450 [Kibdelosporangium philippinense]|uniref:cytochrome P450 n=1 Tax=Kibdelosporangium philippinense TaxID=211113 RepID=UPI00360E343C
MQDSTVSLPELPFSRECPYHPPNAYEQLRDSGPLTRVSTFDGTAVWAVTGHAEMRTLLSDPRLSVDRDHAGFPALTRVVALRRPQQHSAMRTLLRTDPPQHTEQRRALARSFALRKIKSRRPALEATADALLDRVAPDGSAELVESYIKPLVTAGMALLLGIPDDQRTRLHELMYHYFDPIAPLAEYLRELLTSKEPGDGLLDDLIAQVAAGTMSEAEYIDSATVLIVAGQEVTVSTIALAVPTLLTHDSELEQLRTGVVPWTNAVEELLRFLSLTGGTVRIATADIEIAGVVIKAGEGVVLLNPAANRDPAVFERPNELDLSRQRRNHLSFGIGVHQCIGHNLARMDIEVALQRLFERFPTLRLTVPIAEVPVRQGIVFGVTAVPVAW